MIKFGVAGNSNSFYSEGFSRTVDAAKWCKDKGIEIFEYSFGRGVNMSETTAELISKAFGKNNVELSVHAPYYINMANTDRDMIIKSCGYIINSIIMASFMGASRIIVHPASQGKLSRLEAKRLMLDNIKQLSELISNNEYPQDILICWETMGKVGQMGTVDEILDICNLDDRYYPCVDFGHINAREQGILNKAGKYNTILEKLRDNIAIDKFINMHIHFSKIQFSSKGEVRHLTFEDQIYGPEFEPLMEGLVKYSMQPYIICESDGTQAEDTLQMKNYYYKIIQNI